MDEHAFSSIAAENIELTSNIYKPSNEHTSVLKVR